MEDRSIFVITLGLIGILFRGNGGFFRQHHGNIITYRVDPAASLAFQPGAIRKQMYRLDANGTPQNLEKLFRNRHARLRNAIFDSSKPDDIAATCFSASTAGERPALPQERVTIKKGRISVG
jgi:hypothetical protein